MNNFRQEGHALDLTAPAGGVVGGTAYLIGAIFCVAATTQAAGEKFAGWTTGVYNLPKGTGAWAEGDKLYWDDTAKVVTKTVGSNTKVGVAVEATLSAATVGGVRLIPTI